MQTASGCTWQASLPSSDTWLKISSGSSGTGQGTVNFTVDANPQGSAALRRFHAGDRVDYFFNIYNAELDKATGRPRVQTQMRLFRDREQVYNAGPNGFVVGPLIAAMFIVGWDLFAASRA